MKRLIAVTGCLLFICMLIDLCIPSGRRSAEASGGSAARWSAAEESRAAVSRIYVISVFDDRIAVYEKGKKAPVYISDKKLYDLPQEDILAVKKGIETGSKRELRAMLEDFCS